MSDTRKSVVVDIVSDSRKFLSGFEEAIKEIEKSAKKANILGSMQDDISDLRQSLTDINKTIQNIKPTTDDSAILKLQEKMETLNNSVNYLKKNLKEVKLETNNNSSDTFRNELENIKTETAGLLSNLKQLSSVGKQIKFNSDPNSIKNIEDLKNKYNQALDAYNSFSDAQKKQGKEYTEEYKKASAELYKLATLMLEVDSVVFDRNEDGDSGFLSDKELVEVEKTLDSIISITKKKKTEIENIIKDVDINQIITGKPAGSAPIADIAEFKLKEGKISVPLEIGTTAAKLKKQVEDIIAEVQNNMKKVIVVPFKISSATQSKTAFQKELKDLQNGIDLLPDGDIKNVAQSTLDNIKSQFKQVAELKIKTNISEVERDINQGIKAIKKTIKDAGFAIYPEIILSDENRKQLQKDILKLSTSLKIDLPISDLLSSIKELTNEDLIKNWGNVFTSVITEACNRIDSTLSSLQTNASELSNNSLKQEQTTPIDINIKELNEILTILQNISKTLLVLSNKNIVLNLDTEKLEQTNNILLQTYNLLSQLFTVSGFDNLTKEFDILREKFNSIAKNDGSFDARKKEIKELIVEYGKYLELGGKQPISDLTENEKSQKKLIQLYEKQIQQQVELQQISSVPTVSNNTEVQIISELSSKLEDTIRKIQEKNTAFEQENKLVSKVMPEETEKIGKLVSALIYVKSTLDDINKSIGQLNLSNLTGLAQLNKLDSNKLNSLTTSLSVLVQNINNLNLKDGNILSVLQDILNRTNELSALASALQASKGQIGAVQKATGSMANTIYDLNDLKKKGNIYFSRVSNDLTKFEATVKNKFKSLGFDDIQIKAIQSASGTIQKLTVTAKDAVGQLRNFNLERAKIQGKGKMNYGLIQTDTVSVQSNYKTINQHNADAINSYNKLKNTVKDYYDLREKELSNTATTNELARLAEIRAEWDKAIQKKDEYMIASGGSSNIENKAFKTQTQFINSQGNVYALMVEDFYKSVEKKIATINTNKFTQDFKQEVEVIQSIINTLKNSSLDLVTDIELSQVGTLKKLMSDLSIHMNQDSYKLADTTSIDKLQIKISKILSDNTAMSSSLRTQFEGLRNTLRQMGYEIPADRFKELTTTFYNLENQMRSAGETGKSFIDIITGKMKYGWAELIARYLSFQDITRYAREVFTIIKEYDTALTEMNKVSDESIHTLKEFQSESFELADAIGATAQQIQNSTADWMRLGETLEEAKQSAQDTTVLFNVSEFESIDEATEALTSMSQAYKDLEKMEIVDVVNNLGNNFAISTDGLATALQNSASSLLTAKNDFYEAAALTTAANTVVQDPDKVGAGLRTIALRLTGTEAAKKELEELGEDTEGMVVTTVSKLDQKIKDLTKTQGNFGVSLLDMNGNYRSTYEVLLDIAKVWDQIAKEDLETGENRQNALLEMMAGKNRSNILASVLQSPEVLEEAYSYALDSDGSAFKENEAHLESIQGHLDQLKNKWDNLWINENNREVITFFLDLAKSVLDVTNEIGALNTILVGGGGIFAAIKSIQGKGRLKQSSLIFI